MNVSRNSGKSLNDVGKLSPQRVAVRHLRTLRGLAPDALTVCRTGILAQLPLRIPEETVHAPASPRER
ncbi:hypothetical protein [Streptomyces sp. YPW6]|uniref:hypothetical protein n=1 Tax=Streptomyces sp. YPW6 TaxID=2840373 RepID=UPI003F49C90D